MSLQSSARLSARFALGLLLVVGIAAATVVLSADPAAAHGVGGIRPSNYETRIQSVRPAIDGITVRVVDLGSRLEVHNRTSSDLVVVGYDGEPYLRIGPDGVFENRRSPATYLNRDRYVSKDPLPAVADAEGVDWQKVSDGNRWRWHDHRAHWMGRDDPPMVRASPGERHLVQRFSIPLVVGEQTVEIRGAVRWVPSLSVWPSIVAIGVLAGCVVAASRTRYWERSILVAVLLLTAAEMVHIGGLFGATTASTFSTFSASFVAIAGVVMGVVASALIARKGAAAAVPITVFAALLLTFAGGVADITVLWRSQVATTLPDLVARASVATVLGLGIGVFVSAVLRVRSPRSVRSGGEDAERGSESRMGVAPLPERT